MCDENKWNPLELLEKKSVSNCTYFIFLISSLDSQVHPSILSPARLGGPFYFTTVLMI